MLVTPPMKLADLDKLVESDIKVWLRPTRHLLVLVEVVLDGFRIPQPAKPGRHGFTVPPLGRAIPGANFENPLTIVSLKIKYCPFPAYLSRQT